jgi:hypothetical protein
VGVTVLPGVSLASLVNRSRDRNCRWPVAAAFDAVKMSQGDDIGRYDPKRRCDEVGEHGPEGPPEPVAKKTGDHGSFVRSALDDPHNERENRKDDKCGDEHTRVVPSS